ncbi:ribonuclease H-like domain-containing protein, partial [Tanacetum coccineum]
NGNWDLVYLPKGRKAIGSKWIYKIKFRSSGEIDRYKARLVAQGFGKKKGIDYEETFSPVVKMVTVRHLLNIVVSMSWPAPRQWNAKLTSTLIENGFSQSNISEIKKFNDFLKSKFMIKDLGKLKYFFGIEVVDTGKGICLNQRKHVLDLLSDQFKHSPLNSFLKIAFKILRYLKSCPCLGIHITKTSGMFLNAYSDVDWAKCIVTRKSVTREKILNGVVKTVKVNSANQIADILTKGLDTIQHYELVKKTWYV